MISAIIKKSTLLNIEYGNCFLASSILASVKHSIIAKIGDSINTSK